MPRQQSLQLQIKTLNGKIEVYHSQKLQQFGESAIKMSAVFVQTISLILLESLEMVSMNLVLLVCALHLAGFGSALPLLGGVPAEAEDEHLERVKRQNSARNWTLSEFSEVSL